MMRTFFVRVSIRNAVFYVNENLHKDKTIPLVILCNLPRRASIKNQEWGSRVFIEEVAIY